MTTEAARPSEPDPTTPPVREFTNGRVVEYPNLATLREAMVADDVQIVDAIADRRSREQLILAQCVAEDCQPQSLYPARAGALELVDRHYPGQLGLLCMIDDIYAVLVDETSAIQLNDHILVDAIANRTDKAIQAAVFKLNAGEVVAPAQQARNMERAVSLAAERHPVDPELLNAVTGVYSVLIPQTVALQQLEFAHTRLIGAA